MNNIEKNESTQKRKIKFGTASGVVLVLFLAFMILLNVVISALGDKINLKIDFTQEHITSLSDTTVKILKSLDKDINVYSLVPESAGDEIAVNLNEILSKYKRLSPHIKYKVIDANKNPGFMAKYSKTQVSAFSIVFECGNRYKVVEFGEDVTYMSSDNRYIDMLSAEKKFTSAIVYVTGNKDVRIGVLDGTHGEYLYSSKFTAYEVYSDIFKKSNFETSKIDISTEDIPDNIDVLFLGTPMTDYTEDEIKKLDDFLSKGKTLQVCFEFDLKEENVPNLIKFLRDDWGINFYDGVVFEGDPSKYISSQPTFVLPILESNDITDPLIDSRQLVISELPKAVTISKKSDVKSEILAHTSEKSYMKKIDKETNTYKFSDGDVRGSYVISALLTNADTGGKVSVISGGGLLVLTNESSCANADFYNNLISYVTDNKTQISIMPKGQSDHRFTIQTTMMITLLIIFTIIIPVIIIIAGIIIWLRRRHL